MDRPTSSRSAFERAWTVCPPGRRPEAIRTDAVDHRSGIFYSPVEFRFVDTVGEVSDDPPDGKWIIDSLMAFVRGEFGTAASTRGVCPPLFEPSSLESAVPEQIRDFLASQEAFVYSGYVDGLARSVGGDMTEKIVAILADERLGFRKNRQNVTDAATAAIRKLIASGARLRLAFPSFPFKDQNPFRTDAPPGHVDMAELALLTRLHTLALAIYQVHPFGADWIVVSDGRAYASILGVDLQDAEQYFSRLVGYRNLLNLQGTVSIIDLLDLTARLASRRHGSNVFSYTVKSIEEALEQLLKHDARVSDSFTILMRGMKWNINSRRLLADVSWEDKWMLLNTHVEEDVATSLRERWHQLQETARAAALRYAAFNLGLKYHDAFRRLLPDCLRATIHPKPGQIAVPQLGSVFPWNGVGVFESGELSVMPLYEVSRRSGRATAHVLPGDAAPLFYRIH